MCWLGALCCLCGVLGHLAHVHRCARLVCAVACAVSWATWLLFTGVPARGVVLRQRCPGALGSCSPVCSPGVLCCVCGVQGHLAPVLGCARCVCCVACAVSWATWLLFTGAHVRCVVLRVQCSGPLGSCSAVCALGASCCVCGVLSHLAPVHWCARLMRCVACAVSWATWLLFTRVPAQRVVLRLRCPPPLGSWSPVCPLGVLCCLCGVLGQFLPGHRCARLLCRVARPVSLATCLLFTRAPARGVVLRVRCLGPLGSCTPVCPLGVFCCVLGVRGHLAPVHRCVRPACCVACFRVLGHLAAVHRCVRSACCLRMRCPGPLGHCSPVCSLGVWCCACGVLPLMSPVYRCVRLVCCAACAVSWATWLPFPAALPRRVMLCVWCPGPLGSYSPVCSLGVLCCVLCVRCPGPLGSSQGCSCPWCSVASPVSWATWLLFTGLLARCVVLRVRCPGPLDSCSLVCPLDVFCCVFGVLGHLAPVHRCARSACCVACSVSWAT